MLSVHHLHKRFGSVQALNDVSLDFAAGEIHCILGENGAGKSTLMNVLDGVHLPDSGEIRVAGTPVRLTSPSAARAAGIGMVHQHFTLIDAMTVAENLALSVPSGTASHGGWRLDRAAVAEHAIAFAAQVGMALPPAHQLVKELSVGARQRLEILKALMGADRVLILDEPTAVLTPAEVEQLFVLLRQLRAQQRLVIFITHKLREVKDVGDRVTVMRHGRIVSTHTVNTMSEAVLAHEMIGEVAVPERPPEIASSETVLRLRDVSLVGRDGVPALRNVNLEVRAGEILGVAGVDGNGQRELYEILLGLRRVSSGEVMLASLPQSAGTFLTPSSARLAGVSCIPPDRQHEGLALGLSVAENFLLNSAELQQFTRRGILDVSAARAMAAERARHFAIRFADLDQPVAGLSGGNQQRVIVARELARTPQLLVAVNPTRGLDVQATQAVATAIRTAVAAGCAVVLISTDLDELLDLSHRLVVLFRGRLSPPLSPPFDTTNIGELMAGAQEVSTARRGENPKGPI